MAHDCLLRPVPHVATQLCKRLRRLCILQHARSQVSLIPLVVLPFHCIALENG